MPKYTYTLYCIVYYAKGFDIQAGEENLRTVKVAGECIIQIPSTDICTNTPVHFTVQCINIMLKVLIFRPVKGIGKL